MFLGPVALGIAMPALAGLGALRSAHATVMVRSTIDELARESHLVAVVTVRRATGHWENGHIYTDVEVSIDEVVRGTPSAASITVRTPGGVVNDVGQRVEGAPVLTPGRRYVLFLRRRGSHYETLALAQGVLPIEQPAASGRAPRVMPATSAGATLVAPPGGSSASSVIVPAEGMALDAFVRAVRALR